MFIRDCVSATSGADVPPGMLPLYIGLCEAKRECSHPAPVDMQAGRFQPAGYQLPSISAWTASRARTTYRLFLLFPAFWSATFGVDGDLGPT